LLGLGKSGTPAWIPGLSASGDFERLVEHLEALIRELPRQSCLEDEEY